MSIIIADLSENSQLDRQAMRAIAGGARHSGRQTLVRSKGAGIVDYFGVQGTRRAPEK